MFTHVAENLSVREMTETITEHCPEPVFDGSEPVQRGSRFNAARHRSHRIRASALQLQATKTTNPTS